MNLQEHLLSCLAEECAEVAQRVSKALRFGLEEVQPGQPMNNLERIALELNDLVAIKELLRENGVNLRIDHQAVEAKKVKVLKFADYARSQGALT